MRAFTTCCGSKCVAEAGVGLGGSNSSLFHFWTTRDPCFAAQSSLYVPRSDHYMYRKLVNIHTTSLTFINATFYQPSVFMCFMWIWEQTAIISLYSVNWLVFKTMTGFQFYDLQPHFIFDIKNQDWIFSLPQLYISHSQLHLLATFCIFDTWRTNLYIM